MSDEKVVGNADRTPGYAGAGDEAMFERFVTGREGVADDMRRIALTRRVALMLAALTPLPMKVSGRAMMFFIPDGRYRRQVFALVARRNEPLTLYMPNVLGDSIDAEYLVREGDTFSLPDAKDVRVSVQVVDTTTDRDPAPHVVNMLGWNRKALSLVVGWEDAEDERVVVVERLCRWAARAWPAPSAETRGR